MRITEVRIDLAGREGDGHRVRAYASLTIDGVFVVREVKLIEGPAGLFVAMPQRKVSDRCPSCRLKNPITSRYCGQCGGRLADDRAERDESGRSKLYADIASPVVPEARRMIEDAVLAAYRAERDGVDVPGLTRGERYGEFRCYRVGPPAEPAPALSRRVATRAV